MTNPFRSKIISLVVNQCFENLVLFVVVLNCVALALSKENDFVTKNENTIDRVFLILYSIEMILKIIAMGFVTR